MAASPAPDRVSSPTTNQELDLFEQIDRGCVYPDPDKLRVFD